MKIVSIQETIQPLSRCTFYAWPDDSLRIDNVYLTNDDPNLDIVYVSCSSVILAAFSKRKEICTHGNTILTLVENLSTVPLTTSVVID
jgi:hypothetical protein